MILGFALGLFQPCSKRDIQFRIIFFRLSPANADLAFLSILEITDPYHSNLFPLHY